MDERDSQRLADAAARFLGLDIPEALRPGVAANLDLLRQHAARVMALPLEAEDEAAAVFRP